MIADDFLGVVNGLDIDEYHSRKGEISNSGLGYKTWYHYYAHNLAPDRPPRKERAGQLEGNLAHCAILEPHEFDKRYATVPDEAPRRPTSAQRDAKKPSEETIRAIEWWDEFNASTGGRIIISHDQYNTAKRQADSVHRLDPVRHAVNGIFASEVSAFWVDEATGVRCRCRPDGVQKVDDAGVILLDVKTYADASADGFALQVARKLYDMQDAFYTDGFGAASGMEVYGFVFIVVEDQYPFASNALMLEPESQQIGRNEYRRRLDQYAECLRSNIWPSYSTEVQPIQLPRWRTRD